MTVKTGIIFITLALGCLATPTPNSEDLSQFSNHEEQEATTVKVFPNNRLVGASTARGGAHPWVVAMTTGSTVRSFTCAGSIISHRTVLTAAHCIDSLYRDGALPSSLRLSVGSDRWNSTADQYLVSGNATHPNYVSQFTKNDIAMLFTYTDIVFSRRVRPIAIGYEFIGAGVKTRVAGWGRTGAGAPNPSRLLQIDLTTIDGERCERDVAEANEKWPNMRLPHTESHIELCTFHSRGRGTCNGDSGGPLVRVSSGKQVGIVSWGFPCALGAPDVFVRLSACPGSRKL
ncbi:hypothetical protein ABMA28_003958 [Loxostege sticticalis]|uniref:Peptidase S1 domain-containing protein n=1 Tax=Loxostege sticticalis TaxID=481309 RepID=A0ABD0STP7_LOXSC